MQNRKKILTKIGHRLAIDGIIACEIVKNLRQILKTSNPNLKNPHKMLKKFLTIIAHWLTIDGITDIKSSKSLRNLPKKIIHCSMIEQTSGSEVLKKLLRKIVHWWTIDRVNV